MQQVGLFPLQLDRAADKDHHCLSPLPQPRGHPAALLVLNELPGKLLLHPLTLFAAGQEQIAFHLHQMGRHLNERAGDLRVSRLCCFYRAGVLVNEGQDRNMVQVHLVLGHQCQQQLQRAIEIFEVERQFVGHQITAPRLA